MISDLLPKDYPKYLAVTQLIIARGLANAERDPVRKSKMVASIDERADFIAGHYEDVIAKASDSPLLTILNGPNWTNIGRRTLLVDVAFSNPFAPYYLKYGKKERRSQLCRVACNFGLREEHVDEMLRIGKSARDTHRKWYQQPLVWTAIAVGGAVVFGGLGVLAAPSIGSALGSAAGLSGAAATAHGLALLGGGSLAVGGAGMAGGMAVVTAAGVGIGTVTGGGAALLAGLTPIAAFDEIVKLQTTFGFAALPEGKEGKQQAKDILNGLKGTIKELEQKLKQKQDRNDVDAPEIQAIDRTLDVAHQAEAWMQSLIPRQ